ncbi:hypothetical protein BH09PSE5_BH09PSE5_49800 [soil metagenome]
MRVLLLSTVNPEPRDVGKKAVLGGMCDYFRQEFKDADFRMIAFDGSSPGETARLDSRRIGAASKLVSIVWHSLIMRRKSIQEAVFWSDDFVHVLQASIDRLAPDMVIFDTVRIGQYVERLKLPRARKILYLDDLFSLRYRRVLQAMSRFPGSAIDSMGNFGSNLSPWMLRLYRRLPVIQRTLLRVEANLVERSEVRLASLFDTTLLINSSEVELLKERSGDALVDIQSLALYGSRGAERRHWRGEPTFLFLGSLNLPHNGFSLGQFLEEWLPSLIERIPRFKLIVVGRHPTEQLLKLQEQYPEQVILRGYVPDLGSLFDRCAGMLAPLLFGSGVKIKIIDGLRYGIPIIATDVGADGVACDGKTGLIVENDLGKFASHCEQLLDPEVNRRHSQAARRIFGGSYSEGATRTQYDSIFKASSAYAISTGAGNL